MICPIPDTFTSFDNGEGVAEDLFYEAELSHEFLEGVKLTMRGSHQETDFDYRNTSGLYNCNFADGVSGIGLDDPFVFLTCLAIFEPLET
ncbi:MAG: hypothetical protein AAF550_14160 [Myxococcota bacterium]